VLFHFAIIRITIWPVLTEVNCCGETAGGRAVLAQAKAVLEAAQRVDELKIVQAVVLPLELGLTLRQTAAERRTASRTLDTGTGGGVSRAVAGGSEGRRGVGGTADPGGAGVPLGRLRRHFLRNLLGLPSHQKEQKIGDE